MNFEDSDSVIRIRMEIENRREGFLDTVSQESGWDSSKASVAWCVGIHLGDSLARLLTEPQELQDCLDAITDSLAGRISQFREGDA